MGGIVGRPSADEEKDVWRALYASGTRDAAKVQRSALKLVSGNTRSSQTFEGQLFPAAPSSAAESDGSLPGVSSSSSSSSSSATANTLSPGSRGRIVPRDASASAGGRPAEGTDPLASLAHSVAGVSISTMALAATGPPRPLSPSPATASVAAALGVSASALPLYRSADARPASPSSVAAATAASSSSLSSTSVEASLAPIRRIVEEVWDTREQRYSKEHALRLWKHYHRERCNGGEPSPYLRPEELNELTRDALGALHAHVAVLVHSAFEKVRRTTQAQMMDMMARKAAAAAASSTSAGAAAASAPAAASTPASPRQQSTSSTLRDFHGAMHGHNHAPTSGLHSAPVSSDGAPRSSRSPQGNGNTSLSPPSSPSRSQRRLSPNVSQAGGNGGGSGSSYGLLSAADVSWLHEHVDSRKRALLSTLQTRVLQWCDNSSDIAEALWHHLDPLGENHITSKVFVEKFHAAINSVVGPHFLHADDGALLET